MHTLVLFLSLLPSLKRVLLARNPVCLALANNLLAKLLNLETAV